MYKCSDSTRSQIVFRTDIFPRIAIGCPWRMVSQEVLQRMKAHLLQVFLKHGIKLLFCAAGLQLSYLTWGVLQERIVTRSYEEHLPDGSVKLVKFTNSQFLVFVNRSLALVVASVCILFIRQPRHTTPLYKYSYSSFSNITSKNNNNELYLHDQINTYSIAKAMFRNQNYNTGQLRYFDNNLSRTSKQAEIYIL